MTTVLTGTNFSKAVVKILVMASACSLMGFVVILCRILHMYFATQETELMRNMLCTSRLSCQ